MTDLAVRAEQLLRAVLTDLEVDVTPGSPAAEVIERHVAPLRLVSLFEEPSADLASLIRLLEGGGGS